MIGWINNSVESFIRDTFGDDVWDSVLAASDIGAGGWVSSCPYPDATTYTLVITASSLLGVTPAQALEAYGVYFVDYVTKQGYDKLLHSLGSNIAEFLQSLNNLHLHLTMSFPAMAAPVFKCTAVGPESLELHYYSNRPALGPIVVGVLRGLADRYWGLGDQLQVQLLRGREDGTEDHEVFLVTYPHQEALRGWPEGPRGGEAAAAAAGSHPPRSFTVCPDTFYHMFPFHILMDEQCCVVQAGAALTRLFPSLAPGAHLSDTFQLRHPYHPIEYDTICRELNNAFLLKAKETGLELKGQMVRVPLPPLQLHSRTGGPAAAEGLLFMGSVRLAGLDDMREQRLFLSDIPLHDLNRDFVLLAEQRQAEAQLKERFEALTLELKQANARLSEASRWLEEERRRSDQLLYQMLPPQVAISLKQGAKIPASEHPEATILFSDIVGFTEIAARCSPLEVCSLLDELYHRFDTAIEQYPELYKVETIGDAYMVVANVTAPCHEHADLLLEFAVRMHNEAREVRSSSLGQGLRIRVGMHTGPVVAGVVGKKMPRFCLFGDTVNTASRMESHGLPGHIHISDACYACIRNKDAFVIRERGNIAVKGKGMMWTYLIAPAEQEAALLTGFARLSPQGLGDLRPTSPTVGGPSASSSASGGLFTLVPQPSLLTRRASSPNANTFSGAEGTSGLSGMPSFSSVSGLSDITAPPGAFVTDRSPFMGSSGLSASASHSEVLVRPAHGGVRRRPSRLSQCSTDGVLAVRRLREAEGGGGGGGGLIVARQSDVEVGEDGDEDGGGVGL